MAARGFRKLEQADRINNKNRHGLGGDKQMVAPRNPIDGVVYLPPGDVTRYRDAGLYNGQTLGQALHEVCVKFSDRIALLSPDGRMTYAELDKKSDCVAAALLRVGLKPLDRIVIQVGNTPEYFTLLYGCFKAGFIPVCNLVSHREQEILATGKLGGARAIIIQGDFRNDLSKTARKVQSELSGLEFLLSVRGEPKLGFLRLEDLADQEDPTEARQTLNVLDIDPFNVGIFQLSGGTTGVPKIIPRFHMEYLYHMQAWADLSDINSDTISFWPLPAAHNAAMACFNTPVHLRGGAVCVNQSHDPDAFLGTIEREKVTLTGAALPIIVRAIDSGKIPNYDLSSVTDFVTLGESPLVERELKVPANHIFGMAEGTLMRTRGDDPDEVRLHGIGQPVSQFDEIKLCKIGTEELVDEGEVGEFLTRGPYTIRGYFNVPEYNADKFTSNGFYRTGDLMRTRRINGKRYYFFVGRAKDNIDRGMEKISAEEIEVAVLQHPDVLECLVVGMPDREFGEKVCAYIIPKAGSEPLTVVSLGAFLEGVGLAKFKWPERVELVDNFPATNVGKTSKALLRDDIKQKLEDEGRLRA
jgi:2,3-dihydroxybenzoate-AMP ligase